MFNNLKKQAIEKKGNGSFLSETLHIEGEIVSTGSIELAGLVDGNIQSEKLTILDTGSIKGNIETKIVNVDGQVEGDINCTYLFLGSNAVIRGNIYFSETLKTEEGADVDGYIKKTAKQDSKEKESSKVKPSEQLSLGKLGKPILVKKNNEAAEKKQAV